MDSDTSESNLVIITNKVRIKRYFNIYKRTILILSTFLIFLPIAFLGDNNAYLSFYIFLVTATSFVGDFLHSGATSFIPIALLTLMEAFNIKIINVIAISNPVLDCLCVMILVIAIEQSQIHKRVAIKILLIFGCSHFRLSFMLFITTMVLSMWFTNCMACGLMMPVIKAILKELEKMGLLEMYEIIGKTPSFSGSRDNYVPRPSDFTIFYFVGIAYSSSIGGMATFVGSETNQIFINHCATMFPGMKLEFAHYLLLTLPGVLIMEMFLYLWLNFYYLGMLRVQNYTALQASLTNEEEQFISMLLTAQYQQMGKITFHEMVVGATVLLAAFLQAIVIIPHYNENDRITNRSNWNSSVPCGIVVLILFLTPVDANCLKFFKKRRNNAEPLPTVSSRGCITWTTLRSNLNWSVILVTASVNMTFESLEDSKMTVELEKFLLLFSSWPAPAFVVIVMAFCKILTEFASNATVACYLLLHIANVGVKSKTNPFHLMLGGVLSTAVSFHLITGSPANAMVSSYVHIPPKKMLIAGVGPSVIAVLMNAFTVLVWTKVIWPDIDINRRESDGHVSL